MQNQPRYIHGVILRGRSFSLGINIRVGHLFANQDRTLLKYTLMADLCFRLFGLGLSREGVHVETIVCLCLELQNFIG